MGLPKTNTIVTIKLKSRHRSESAKSAGIAYFDLSDLLDGKAELRESKLPGGGSVTAIFCRSPNWTIKVLIDYIHLYERLPSLRVVLERSTYYPGELVRGVLRYHELQERAISSIRVGFDGQSFVSWNESSQATDSSRRISVSRATLLRHTTVLLGPADYQHKTQIGPNFYFERAIEFRLPNNLAPSCVYSSSTDTEPVNIKDALTTVPSQGEKLARNIYQAIAFVDVIAEEADRKGSKASKSMPHQVSITPFNIMVPPTQDELENWIELSNVTNLHGHSVTVYAECPENLVAGKEFPVTIRIDNSKGKRPISSCRVAFYRTLTLTHVLASGGQGTDRRTFTDAYLKHSAKSDYFPILPGVAATFKMKLKVPQKDLIPTLFSPSSPLLQVSHYIQVTAETDTMEKARVAMQILAFGAERREQKVVNIIRKESPLSSLQSRVFIPTDMVQSAAAFAPHNSEDGKRIEQGWSTNITNIDFEAFSAPVDPEQYDTYDVKLHGPNNGAIHPAEWQAGTAPYWAKEQPKVSSPEEALPVPTGSTALLKPEEEVLDAKAEVKAADLDVLPEQLPKKHASPRNKRGEVHTSHTPKKKRRTPKDAILESGAGSRPREAGDLASSSDSEGDHPIKTRKSTSSRSDKTNEAEYDVGYAS